MIELIPEIRTDFLLKNKVSHASSFQTQSTELCSSFTLLSPHAIIRLRFPVPDLRPLPIRRPPTHRVVREETLVLELMELELKHQEAPDLQNNQANQGQPGSPCLTQLLEASFTDLHGESTCNLVQQLLLNDDL